MNTNESLREMMERYEQELLRLRQQAIPVAAPAQTPPTPPAPTPIPSAPPLPPQPPIQSQMPPSEPSAPLNGFLASFQVRATAANEALPIPNALIAISRETAEGPVLEQIRLTNISGLTEPVLLPATDPALTMQPADNIPLITYEIQASAPGYYRVRNTGVPLFGGIPTVLPVTMLPLPEFEEPDTTELAFPTPRNNL